MQACSAGQGVDFRRGHDGLATLVKNELHTNPFTGTVFVFRSKRADRLKLLYWDGTGLVMAYKRLEDQALTGRALHAREVVHLARDPGWCDEAQPCPV